ncbi:hypothetical protein RA263_28245, partial [Pseudomonas syringae pv. tagetis]|uniref:hypothetical protein n=1 Tax=Pseudomonas syringae group genomosp. 7 TaxID=251699 RepID=UPI00376F54BC
KSAAGRSRPRDANRQSINIQVEEMKINGLRWWMVRRVTAGLVVNNLARNTLSVAAPTLMSELGIST